MNLEDININGSVEEQGLFSCFTTISPVFLSKDPLMTFFGKVDATRKTNII